MKIHSSELAKWLDIQGDNCWWSVDNENRLMSKLSFPCVSSELAAELRKIDRDICVDFSGDPSCDLSTCELDELFAVDEKGNRFAAFKWDGDGLKGWLLTEDRDIESYAKTATVTDNKYREAVLAKKEAVLAQKEAEAEQSFMIGCVKAAMEALNAKDRKKALKWCEVALCCSSDRAKAVAEFFDELDKIAKGKPLVMEDVAVNFLQSHSRFEAKIAKLKGETNDDSNEDGG